MLDAGAGTGLLALGARRRVGPSGRVYALDQSVGSLRMVPLEMELEPLTCVAGDVGHLPFADRTLDAVLTRSVLMYVADKVVAAREFHRVLRGPRGRAVLFEPINRVSARHMWNWELDLSAIQPDHDRVVAYLEAHWEDREAMMGFDERDLVGSFVEAGFRSVDLSYTYHYARDVRAPALLSAWLRNRQTGTALSYEEAAVAVLGERAPAHLLAFDRIAEQRPASVLFAHAYVTAMVGG